MNLFTAIENRYSYRGKFLRSSLPEEDLLKILSAGAAAPSGMNGQSTSFVAVTEPGKIADIAAILGGNRAVSSASLLIAVVMDPAATAERGFCFGVEDYAAAVENMLLAITALGYATVWIDGALRRDQRCERISSLLGIPDNLDLRVVLPVGRPAEEGPRKDKKPLRERAWLNEWGGQL